MIKLKEMAKFNRWGAQFDNEGFSLVEALVATVILAIFLLGLSFFSINMNTSYDKDQVKVELNREGNFAIESMKFLKKRLNNDTIAFGLLQAKGMLIETNDGNQKLVVVLSRPDPQDSTKEIYYLGWFYQEGNNLMFRYKYDGILSTPEVIIPSSFVKYNLSVQFTYPTSFSQTLTVDQISDEAFKKFLQAEGINELHDGINVNLKLTDTKFGYGCSFSSLVYCRNFGG